MEEALLPVHERDSSAGHDLRVVLARIFAVPALGGFLFGYDIGASSAALSSLTSPIHSGTLWGPSMGAVARGAVVSASLVGAASASTAALARGHAWGRRHELRCAALCYTLGALSSAFATNLVFLALARTLYGCGIGLALHAAPMFLAESAPESLRGALVAGKEAAIVTGILCGFLGGAVLIDDHQGWRGLYFAPLVVALAMAAGAFCVIAESPRWLAQRGAGKSDVLASLVALRSRVPVESLEAEAACIVEAAAEQRQAQQAAASGGAATTPTNAVSSLISRRHARPLYVGVSLMLFQQITGQPSILYFAVQTFEEAGFSSPSSAAKVSVLLGVVKLVATLVAVASVDKLGRRPLLLCGVSVLTASLGLLSLFAGAFSPLSASSSATASAAALLVYVSAYQLSFGPISWLLVGEIFPSEVRSAAVGLASLINFGSNALVALAFPALVATLGRSGSYAAFAALGEASIVSIALTVPETKGKTMEQIEASWARGR